jgi:hypothetical protein
MAKRPPKYIIEIYPDRIYTPEERRKLVQYFMDLPVPAVHFKFKKSTEKSEVEYNYHKGMIV